MVVFQKKSAKKSKSASKPTTKIAKNAPQKRVKKAKMPKDPNKPKRARSAYMFFCQEERLKIVKQNPGISAPDVLRACGAAWQALSEAQKKPWQAKQEQDKIRAASEMKKYNSAAKETSAADTSDAE